MWWNIVVGNVLICKFARQKVVSTISMGIISVSLSKVSVSRRFELKLYLGYNYPRQGIRLTISLSKFFDR